jgi:hypothetical protein
MSELVKINVQVNCTVRQGSLAALERDILQSIWQREGLRGLACGMQLTAMRDVVYRGIYFALYESLARSMTGNSETRSASVTLFAGGVSGMAPWIFAYPIDVLKTHWQSGRRFESTTISGVLRKGLALEGPQWLGRGMCATLMRAMTMNAAVWSVYEQLRRLGLSAYA